MNNIDEIMANANITILNGIKKTYNLNDDQAQAFKKKIESLATNKLDMTKPLDFANIEAVAKELKSMIENGNI